MDLDPSVDLARPHGLFVRVYLSSSGKEQATSQKALEAISGKYTARAVGTDTNTVLIDAGRDRYSLQLIERLDCRVFTLVGNFPQGNSIDWVDHVASYFGQSQAILQSLPERPISQLSVLIGFVDSETDAIVLSEHCSRDLNCEETARGITRGCLVTALDTIAEQDGDYPKQNYLVLPFRKPPSDSKPDISRFHEEFIHLAESVGKLDSLCRSNEPFFGSLATAERETQEAIEQETIDNLFVDFGSLRQTQISRLETWLGQLITKYSSLSMLASAIRRDSASADAYVAQIRSMLSRWNEKVFEGYPTNASTEMLLCEEKTKPFRNFLERAEALRAQLKTVLDSLQTFVGFAQQKTAERQANTLKLLTWVMAVFTIILVLIEVLTAFHILG